jgi:parallel beta-helix repeat protein
MKMLRFTSVGLRASLLVALFLSTAQLLNISTLFAQGPLTPPGPPAPTMKSLEQIASTGIAINATNTPGDTDYHFIINTAGNYFLTSNLAVTKTNGIHVIAAGVTIELNGFQITRGSGSGGEGITIDGLGHRCTVKNGSLGGGFDYGIRCVFSPGQARSGSFRQLAVYNCNTGLTAGDGWQIDRCTAHDNTYGIGCSNGNTVTNSTAFNNFFGFSGRQGSTLTNCSARFNRDGFESFGDSTFTNCSATGNSGAGFVLSPRCTLVGCIATDNSGSIGILGFGSTNLISCTATGNGVSSSAPDSSGISVGDGSTIKDCTASNNKGDGIRAGSGCVILNNTCVANGSGVASGIHVTGSKNRIEGNAAIDNQVGFKVDSDGNLIIKNSNRGGATAFSIAAGNSEGEEINVFNPATTTIVTSSNPWANFKY